jgi:integrase
MPLYLQKPDARHPSYRIRGSHLTTKVDISTGLRDRSSARKELKLIEKRIEDKRYRAGPTFDEAAASYVKAKQKKQEARFLWRVMKQAAEFSGKLLTDITQADIDDVAMKLYPHHKPSSRNRAVYTPIMAVMTHAGVPFVRTPTGGQKKIARPDGAQGEARLTWLSVDDAFAILAAARSRAMHLASIQRPQFVRADRRAADSAQRFFVFLMFLLYTGCRYGEGKRVRAANLDLDRNFCFVGKTKNGHPRGVHLPPQLVEELRRLSPRDDGRMFYDVTAYKFREIAEVAGVHIPERVAFHILRHTFGSWARRYAGLDTSGLVATGAWKSRAAAMIYEHVDASEEARKADLFPVFRDKVAS